MAHSVPPTSARHAALEPALRELPVFPLPQAVLFPGAVMPLHIFEPRYRQMVKDALDTHHILVVTQLLPSGEAPAGQPPIARVAGAGAIVEAHELPDGRFNILLEGRARVHLTEMPFVPPYRRARGEILEDRVVEVPEADQQSLIAVANAFAAHVQSKDPSFSFHLPSVLPSSRIADLCAHHLILDAKERQAILECLDPALRVRMVSDSLALQLATLNRDIKTAMN